MTTIIKGKAAALAVTLQTNGAALAIASGATVTGRLYSVDGLTALSPLKTLSSSTAGANWPSGIVVAEFTAPETDVLAAGDVMLVINCSSPAAVKRFRVAVELETVTVKSALFVRDFIIDELRADRLLSAASSVFGGAAPTDDYLWEKVRAAESEIAHALRVPLVPTQFYPAQPTQAEIDALAGMPWDIDPGYDVGPDLHAGDRWGMIKTRNKPIIDIQRYRFAYPAVDGMVYDIPLDWLRPDKKYGMVNIVPSSYSISVPLSGLVLQALSAGRTVPLMLQVTYTAGLANAARDFPELLDAIKKLAVLKTIEDNFMPQSGSISADGLSQSVSVDMEKYRDTVDHIINGGKGSNGGLMVAIHGVRAMVL